MEDTISVTLDFSKCKYPMDLHNKLSEKFGLTPVYAVDGETDVATWKYTPHQGKSLAGEITMNSTANGFRLPTEKEWVYAAKGGQKYKYSGSDNLDEVGWYNGNSGDKTHSVGQKKANAYGLYDMSGNAWEWCSDNYEIYYYKNSPQKNPKGPAKGIGKVNRGGCYNFDYRLMKNSHRRGSGEESIGTGTGFRIVK